MRQVSRCLELGEWLVKLPGCYMFGEKLHFYGVHLLPKNDSLESWWNGEDDLLPGWCPLPITTATSD